MKTNTREGDGCGHDKETHNIGESKTISMTTAKNFLSLSGSKTHTANTQIQVCTDLLHCEYAQEQAKSHFINLRRKLENGGAIGSAPDEGLEKDLARFNLQSGELPSQLDRIDVSEDELVDLWEDAEKLENAVQQFEEEALDQEQDLYTWFRDKPGFDNVPKEAQPLESVKEVTNRVQTRAEQELLEKHGVSKNELEDRVKKEKETETENESQNQEEEQRQTEERRQRKR